MKRPARPGETRENSRRSGEKAPHHAGVGTAGVGIRNPAGEELIGGKQGLRAGALEDGRD